MKIGEILINELIKDKEVISATIVGSYSEKKNIDQIGDIDIVVICKKLSKKIYFNLVKKIKKRKFQKNTLINSSFGPVKMGSKTTLPIHLMIYDINSHKNHVLNSPFTCYDWERSKMYKGIPLKKIYSAKSLQLNDFFESRRNSKEYLSDLKKNKISIRSYIFKGNKVSLKKKYIKIDPRNRGEFVYHIINFLVINLFKFIYKKNIKVSGLKFDKFFLKITKNDNKLLNNFKNIKKNKINKKLQYNLNTIKLAISFITKYSQFLQKIKNEYIELNFVRHARTSMNKNNLFIGSRSDPKIITIKNKKINKLRYDYIITSNLKRSKMSAKFFRTKKTINTNLINEIDYGYADGFTLKMVKKKYPYIIKSWKKGIDVRFPKGENTNDVNKRVQQFFLFLKKFKKKTNILIISHSFFLRVLIGLILKIDLKKVYKIKIDHLKIFQFLTKNNIFVPNFSRLEQEKIYNQIND